MAYNIEYLIVAGGGGGGKSEPSAYGDGAGGGGGGGYLRANVSFSSDYGEYTIVVGPGGIGSTNNAVQGSNGANSVFDALTAIGGGGGGSDNSTATENKGANGASGGGAANFYSNTANGGAGVAGQGYKGGDAITSSTSYRGGSGGGGANSVGITRTNTCGGAGGTGLTLLGITFGGGGGGGGEWANAGLATQGGGIGGPNGYAVPQGANGTNQMGGGGGGGGTNNGTPNGFGGNGGSGIIVLQYAGNRRAAGGIAVTANGLTTHTFTSNTVFINFADSTPMVDAGPDQFVLWNNLPFILTGSATDDGLPNPPAALTYQWSQTSGPGTVTFANSTSPTTNASVDVRGHYVIRLTVSDSVNQGWDEMTAYDPPYDVQMLSPSFVARGASAAPGPALLMVAITPEIHTLLIQNVAPSPSILTTLIQNTRWAWHMFLPKLTKYHWTRQFGAGVGG